MNLVHVNVKENIFAKKAIKIITGLNNFDMNYIVRVVKAAEISKATYLDIVANPKIVSLVKSITSVPICVSSINPIE